jgi:hypothetical protein
MMKKLLFCLLVLTGTGVLSSCQQDEIVKETPAEKGATIRASLPVDAQSRVTLGATDGTTTDIYWEEDDELTVTIDGTDYTFTISNFKANSTTATFTCANAPALTAGTYTFNYGAAPDKQQSGTLEDLNEFQMQATYTAQDGDTWNDVSLTFDTQVAIVEIALPDGATKVSLYDATNGALIAFAEGTFTGNAYFALTPATTIGGGLVLAETASNVYMAEATTSKTLEAGKLYSIKKTMERAVNIGAAGSNVKYALFGATDPVVVFYGEGKMEFSSRNWFSATRAIVVEGITNIANETFKSCSNITSITIPKSVTSIGKTAFSYCSYITSITIPESVTSIGEQAFNNCENLTKVNIPNGVTRIELGTFWTCKKLTSINIPESVEYIGSYAFSGCTKLASITCLATNPPTLEDTNPFANTSIRIYVPVGSVDDYKVAANWSNYEDKIEAIQ